MNTFTNSNVLRANIKIGQQLGFFPWTEQQAETEYNSFQTNAERIRHYYEAMKKVALIPNWFDVKMSKSITMAGIAREKGATESKRNFLKALEYLNESLCLAPQNSATLGLAYADRSEIFAKTGFFSFALENIELALASNYPEEMKPKLQKRKDDILKQKEEHQDSYEIYRSIEEITLSHSKHPTIPFIVNGLAWAHNDDIGRHIVTNRDLEPGEILVLEDLFLTAPYRYFGYKSCYNCTEHNFFNLIPCPNSSKVMFCSEACRQKAWDSYYKYECPITEGILDWLENNFAVRATFKALMLFQDRTEFRQLIVQGAENPFEHNFEQIDEITKFRIFNSMPTNEDQRSYMQNLMMIFSCATAFHMVKEFTELKEEFSNDPELEDVFLELLLRYHQIAEVNNFDVTEPFKRIAAPTIKFSDRGMAQVNYLVSSLFGHSCAPNAAFITANTRGKLGIVTLQPIKAGDPIYISYGPQIPHDEKQVRQETLRLKYQFDCRCVACEDVETFSCKLEKKKLILPWELSDAIYNICPDECIFNEVAQTCATYVRDNIPKVISFHFDKHYPCKEIQSYQEVLIGAILINVFKKPMELIYYHPSKSCWIPSFCCIR